MTENEAIKQIKEHLDIAGCEDLMCETEALELAIQALEEVQQYRAIGTIEEFKALKLKEHNYDNCHNYTCRKKCEKDGYNKAIDEAIEASAKSICIGCGYLDRYKCKYKGANCGVSKPMLESVVKALEQLKGGAI